MNQLLPIIRRKRRAFLPVEDVPPMAVGTVELGKGEAGDGSRGRSPHQTESDRTNATEGTHDGAQATDENVPTSRQSR